MAYTKQNYKESKKVKKNQCNQCFADLRLSKAYEATGNEFPEGHAYMCNSCFKKWLDIDERDVLL